MRTIAILFTALLGLAASAVAAGLPTARPEVVVSMLQAPLGQHYNPLMRSLVLQAVTQ